MTEWIIISVLALALLSIAVFFIYRAKSGSRKKGIEIHEKESKKINTLIEYVEAQKREEDQRLHLKALKAAEQKEKLENFKKAKEEIKEKLKAQFAAKEWQPLSAILKKADKGSVGIYVLYNETKGKFYVGQSKEIFARVKKHFEVEPIAMDFLRGDAIKVKFLTASELDADYRIDHLEKTGIEIFDSKENGYNKTEGNL